MPPLRPSRPPLNLRRAQPRKRPRAFALPLVILLTLIVSLAVAVLMQRNGVAFLAARRQADGYINHHAGLGMREMVSRWLTTVRGRLKESIEDDGFVFSLELPEGTRVDVFMDDAQGTALARADAFTGRRREIVEMMNAYLDLVEESTQLAASSTQPASRAGSHAAKSSRHANNAKESRAGRVHTTGLAGSSSSQPTPDGADLRRMYGPSEISIKTAPREVLEALASAVTDPKRAKDVADALIRKRDDQTGTRDLPVDEVTRILREIGLDDDELHEINAMIVYTPTLYRVTAEIKGSGGRLIEKARGLMIVDEGHNDPFNQNGPFLTWETVPLEDEPAGQEGR